MHISDVHALLLLPLHIGGGCPCPNETSMPHNGVLQRSHTRGTLLMWGPHKCIAVVPARTAVSLFSGGYQCLVPLASPSNCGLLQIGSVATLLDLFTTC